MEVSSPKQEKSLSAIHTVFLRFFFLGRKLEENLVSCKQKLQLEGNGSEPWMFQLHRLFHEVCWYRAAQAGKRIYCFQENVFI